MWYHTRGLCSFIAQPCKAQSLIYASPRRCTAACRQVHTLAVILHCAAVLAPIPTHCLFLNVHPMQVVPYSRPNALQGECQACGQHDMFCTVDLGHWCAALHAAWPHWAKSPPYTTLQCLALNLGMRPWSPSFKAWWLLTNTLVTLSEAVRAYCVLLLLLLACAGLLSRQCRKWWRCCSLGPWG